MARQSGIVIVCYSCSKWLCCCQRINSKGGSQSDGPPLSLVVNNTAALFGFFGQINNKGIIYTKHTPQHSSDHVAHHCTW